MWNPIPNYEKLYAISDSGHVKRLKGFWCRKDRRLKEHLSNTGRLRVRLCNRDGKQGRKYQIHRLVWIAFKGPIPNGLTINHLNGIPTDNRLNNLELATMSEQMIHAYATGLQQHAKGEARINVAKLTEKQVLEIRQLYQPRKVTYKKLGKKFGVSAGCILLIVHRERWRHI